ncbi:MAG: CPBP family intramembrane metalloprotease [Spirochaetes bacterium]|nr:MAG: CPBP family intramembrane metalloprotease [Spirochaetota bacterium]
MGYTRVIMGFRVFAAAMTVYISMWLCAHDAFPLEVQPETDSPAIREVRPALPNPVIAGLYSLLFPGAGYYYSGDSFKGTLTAPLILPMTSYYYITTDTFTKKSIKANAYLISRDLYFYTVFDAYQEARENNPGYNSVLNIKHSTAFEMYTAPFQIDNYRIPSLILALPVYYLARDLSKKGVHHSITSKRLAYALPLIAAESVMIGVGEESLSRGFFFSAFSQATSSVALGNILQATDFGLRHTDMMASRGFNAFPYGVGTVAFYTRRIDIDREYVAKNSESANATDSQYFFSTFLFGLYNGLITGSRADGILTAIAIHSMWDMILITRDLLVTGTTGKIYLEIAVPYRF